MSTGGLVRCMRALAVVARKAHSAMSPKQRAPRPADDRKNQNPTERKNQ